MPHYELPKELHPDFSDPRRKPTGPVEVDWSHPLARHIVHYIVDYHGQPYDLVTKQKLIKSGTNADGLGVNSQGTGYESDTATLRYLTKDQDRLENALEGAIFVTGSYGTLAADDRIFSLGASTTDVPIFSIGSGASASASARLFFRTPSGPTISLELTSQYVVDHPISIYAGAKSSDEADLRTSLGNNTQTSVSALSAMGFDRVAVGGLMRAAAVSQSDSIVNQGIVFDKKLTAEQADSLLRSPYQLLRPAIPLYYYLPVAATTPRVYELPKELHPDFSNPKRKPVGPVEVDYSNPITNGLYDWTAFGAKKDTPKSTDAVVKASAYGQGYGINNVAALGWEPDMRQVMDDGDTPLSVFVLWSQSNFSPTTNGDALYSERPDSTQIFKITLDSNAGSSCNFSFVMRDAASAGLINRPVTIEVDQTRLLHTGAFVQRSGTNRDVYCDGQTANITTSNTGAFSTAVNPMICNDPQDIANSRADQSTVHAVFTWRRALSDEEVKSLEANPYQLLKPAIPMFYTIAGTGGDTYTLTADSGSYTYSGTDATLAFNRVLTAAAGSFTYSGTDATLAKGWAITAEGGAYTYSGTDATLAFNRVLTADGGTYNLSGTDATLAKGWVITAEGGTYNLSGTDVTFTYTPAGITYTLTANSGAYTYSGTDAGLIYNRVITLDSGEFSLSGEAVVFRYSGSIGNAVVMAPTLEDRMMQPMITTREDTPKLTPRTLTPRL